MMIYVCVWILGFVQSEKCYNDLSNGASGSWFCCNNHEEKTGECVECDIGYISKDGLPCKPCSLGLWGRRCRDVCRCQHNESIAAIFALASCCLKNKRKVDNLNKSRPPRTQHDQVSSDRTNVQFDNESNAYDSIEEDKLKCNGRSEHTNEVEIIFSTIVNLDVSSTSYNEGVATDPSKEEYSNTCQSMIEADVHGYRHSAGESTQKSKELSSERSTKSMVDARKGNNGSRIGCGHKFPSL
ncbi:MEGF10_11 [Mytilus coruscus]|uniref:MEGF10_11 n=1 Tax=Mytilus coruscus TaxID=42192 RepID=A0A6J8B6H3_MYTCO|nr:MEGF10_11 [Mytilus coruscus]